MFTFQAEFPAVDPEFDALSYEALSPDEDDIAAILDEVLGEDFSYAS